MNNNKNNIENNNKVNTMNNAKIVCSKTHHKAYAKTLRLVRLDVLKFDVKCGDKVVIPAGTENVAVRFRASHLHRYDENKQCYVPLNVYYYAGKIYHA